MRISDWSSDVCSSDLRGPLDVVGGGGGADLGADLLHQLLAQLLALLFAGHQGHVGVDALALDVVRETDHRGLGDRKSVVEGRRVSVRVDLGGRRLIKQKKNSENIR